MRAAAMEKKGGAASGGKPESMGEHEAHTEHPKIANYDGHDHEGHMLAHHVEIHHGGHPEGEPPMHEGHTHHVIAHPHPDHGSEPTITNHETLDDAFQHAHGAMHEGCPECDQPETQPGEMTTENEPETA